MDLSVLYHLEALKVPLDLYLHLALPELLDLLVLWHRLALFVLCHLEVLPEQ